MSSSNLFCSSSLDSTIADGVAGSGGNLYFDSYKVDVLMERSFVKNGKSVVPGGSGGNMYFANAGGDGLGGTFLLNSAFVRIEEGTCLYGVGGE
jgi:hypothetical protein